MNAAAELEDASHCLRDEDAKRTAISGAKHYRDAAKALYTRPQPAAPAIPDPMTVKLKDDWRIDDWGTPIIYDTDEVDEVTHALTGDEGEEDSLTVLNSMAGYVSNVWPGKTAMQVLIEYEEVMLAAAPEQKGNV